MLLVYCSEASAVCGLNPYVSISTALEKIWRERWNYGKSYQDCKQRLRKKTSTQVTSRQEQVQCIIQTNPQLSSIVESFKVRAENIQNSSASSSPVTQTESINTLVQTVQDKIANLPILSAEHSQLRNDIVKEISSQVLCTFGRSAEQSFLNQQQHDKQTPIEKKIYNNNDKFYIKTISYRDNQVQLGGRIDGLLNDGTLVEIKNRKSRLFTSIPVYELVQVHCYMYLLDKSNCKLIQKLGNEQDEKSIEWDEELWTSIIDRLDKFTKCFHYFIENLNVQEEFVLEKDKNKQEQLIQNIIRNF